MQDASPWNASAGVPSHGLEGLRPHPLTLRTCLSRLLEEPVGASADERAAANGGSAFATGRKCKATDMGPSTLRAGRICSLEGAGKSAQRHRDGHVGLLRLGEGGSELVEAVGLGRSRQVTGAGVGQGRAV
eukprot:5675878-Pleurochrysis_carterae.AAC.4